MTVPGASAASSRGVGRRAGGRTCLFVSAMVAGLVACDDPTPRILDVSWLHDSGDPRGPFEVTASVRGGDAPLRVRLRFTSGDDEALEGPCDGPPAPDPGRVALDPDAGAFDGGPAESARDGGRPPDAGIASSGLCHAVPLRSVGGGRFVGQLLGPPFPLGTTLRYVVVARDADGDADHWPRGPAGTFVIGPPGRAPRVLAVAPRRGPAAGGTEVLLRGEGFAPGLGVRFGDEAAVDVRVESPHLALAITPPNSPGTYAVVVNREWLESQLPSAFTYLPPPVVERISPAEGPTAGGTLLLVEGEGLESGGTLLLGDTVVPAIHLTSAVVAATVPPGPPSTVDVVYTNPDGQAARLPAGWTWRPPPRLDAIEPERGPDFGGTRVVLRGADLRAPGAVYLDDRPVAAVSVDAGGHSASFVTAAHVEGVVDVVFYNPDGQSDTLERAFRFVGPPVLDAAEPGLLGRCGGGEVTLVGRNLEPGVRVFFDEVDVEVLEVAPDGTRVTVRAPPGEAGPVRIRVENPDGRAAAADGLVVYGVVPVITSVEPPAAPVWGGTLVRVAGGDFEADVEVEVGGAVAEQVLLLEAGCDALLEVRVPPGEAGWAELRVRNSAGAEARRLEGIEYVAPALFPSAGLVPGYTNVELRGLDLRAGLTVRLGPGRIGDATRIDDELWRFVTRPGARGPASLEVRNADGRGAVIPDAFTYRVFTDEASGRVDAGRDCNDVVVADLDGDGTPDLATANGTLNGFGDVEQPLAIHLNRGGGRFDGARLQPAGNGMNLRAGDIDGDEDLDLLVANLSSARNQLFLNDGDGRFRVDPGFIGAGPSYDADLIDVDGDGDLDVFLLMTGAPEDGNESGPERLYVNEGGDRWVERSDDVYFGRGDVHDHAVAQGDLDGDGLPDLVVAVDNLSGSFRSATNRVLLNTTGREGRPGFEFVPSPINRLRGDWLHVESVDVDSDGDRDIVMAQDFVQGLSDPDMPPIALFLNDGAARFEPAFERVVGLPHLPAFNTVTVDLDADGDRDMLFAVYGLLFEDGSIETFPSVALLNDGETRFHAVEGAFEHRPALATSDFGVADFDADGDLDLFECAARGESRLWFQVE